MKGLINFFEEKLGKKVNIYKYEKDRDIKKSQEIVVWDNEKYIVEIIENNTDINLNRNFYLIYQKNINKEMLDNVFTSLYENVNLINYNGNYIVSTKNRDLIDINTPQIIETEVYEKTYIINLGTITKQEELSLKIELANRLKRYIFIENSNRKYFDIYDLGIYNLIDLVGKEKSYSTLFDYNLIDKMDNIVLETGIAFIENGFNISKTSNNIYLHRNTLIYRLEKIKDIMCMDIKNFNEALIYYVIVKNYLVNKNM